MAVLYGLSELRGLRIRARDGDVGCVEDFYFDDEHWLVRHLVVDTGTLLIGREVLIAPENIGKPDFDTWELPVSLTREQIRNSPDVNSELTVSRREEQALAENFGWPAYWLPATFIPGTAMEPPPPLPPPDELSEEGAPHVRSAHEMVGYHIEATDSVLGRASDLLIDDDGWAIRYLVVNTRHVIPGRKVLVAPQWIAHIRWLDRRIELQLSKEQIRNSPALDLSTPISREYEERLHQHYDQPGYWQRLQKRLHAGGFGRRHQG